MSVTPPLATVRLRVNGREYAQEVPPRLLLSDFLRHDSGSRGPMSAVSTASVAPAPFCSTGSRVRSCLMLAIQADGAEVTTVEGLAPEADGCIPFRRRSGASTRLQCGFCTPGFLMTVTALLREHPRPER